MEYVCDLNGGISFIMAGQTGLSNSEFPCSVNCAAVAPLNLLPVRVALWYFGIFWAYWKGSGGVVCVYLSLRSSRRRWRVCK